MDTISSAEFRKTYPRLKAAVQVDVHGHPIGLWIPFDADGYAPVDIRNGAIYEGGSTETKLAEPIKRLTQPERDAILRRVNKGG